MAFVRSLPQASKNARLKPSPPDRLLARVGLAAAIAILAAVCLSTPGESAWLPPCVFFNLTDFYCPGCGSTRMLFALVHGHPLDAFRYNPFSMLVFPIVLYSLIRKSFDISLPALPQVSRRWITALVFTLILFTVARNIPAEPFCKLAPGCVCRGGALKTLSSPHPLRNPRNSQITISLILQTFLDKG